MLKNPVFFVRNEHTCLLPVEASFSPRLPTKINFGFAILDFGLLIKFSVF